MLVLSQCHGSIVGGGIHPAGSDVGSSSFDKGSENVSRFRGLRSVAISSIATLPAMELLVVLVVELTTSYGNVHSNKNCTTLAVRPLIMVFSL